MTGRAPLGMRIALVASVFFIVTAVALVIVRTGSPPAPADAPSLDHSIGPDDIGGAGAGGSAGGRDPRQGMRSTATEDGINHDILPETSSGPDLNRGIPGSAGTLPGGTEPDIGRGMPPGAFPVSPAPGSGLGRLGDVPPPTQLVR